MPKNVFDYTEMKSRIDEYIRQLGDLATTAADSEQYMQLCMNVAKIRGLTDYYYTPKPDGTFPVMNEQDRLDLIQSYYDTINTIRPILQGQDTGEVGLAMREIASQMGPELMRDVRGLEVVDLKKENMSLPELISKGRTTAVDLGKQKANTVGGLSSSRMYLRLEEGDGVQNGYFTANTVVNPRGKYAALLSDLEKKYPSMKNIIGSLRNVPVKKVAQIDAYDVNIMAPVVRLPKEQQKAKYDEMFCDEVYFTMDLDEGVVNEARHNPDYFKFSQEFMDRLKPIHQEYRHYLSGNFVDTKEGANIDRRNVAMYRMAGLLGKQHIIPETKLLTVVQDGRPIAGTFMAEAQGVDCRNAGPDHPIMKAKPEAFENPSVVSDIAGMQVLDYICGNVDRHPGNFMLRFDPPEGPDMKLVGITAIDNDMSFGTDDGSGRGKGTKWIRPDQMGVVGQEMYNAMKLMTRDQMELMLADCRLSKEELDAAWARKENLQKAIEADMEYFKDKEPGYIEEGRIRVVPENEWDKYSIHALAEVHPQAQFNIVRNYAKVTDIANRQIEESNRIEQQANELKQELGVPVPQADPGPKEPATAKAVGTGLQQNPNPIVHGEDTLNLALPSLSKVRSVGNNLSKRYVLTYNENGQEKTVFYTPPQISSAGIGYNRIINDTIASFPKYREELEAFRDYYRQSDMLEISFPSRLDMVDGVKLGFTQEKWESLKADPGFQTAFKAVSGNLIRDMTRYVMMFQFGQDLGDGHRIELRNVAMSEVGDLLGTDDLLCRSRTANVMCDGKLTEGVVMDLAKGEDPGSLRGRDDHPIQFITEEQAKECYNQPEPLKQMADMQILDFVCMNIDRHFENIFYEYEGLGTDHPKLVGIQGIDNDGSFGKLVPSPTSETNKLPALNNMKVISREVWEKMQDPQFPEKVEQVILKRGMTQEEANAAKERVRMVREAVNSGKLRIVEKDQWAKGENTFEKLAEGPKGNLFHTVKNQLVDPCAQKAADHVKKGEHCEIKPKKPFKGTMCAKVDEIGSQAKYDAKMEELSQEAEKEWQKEIQNNLRTAPEVHADSYAEYVRSLRTAAMTLKQNIDDANPFFSFTSKTYKNMIKACNELVAQTDKAIKNMEKNGEAFNEKDAALLDQKLNKLRDSSAAYTQKKNAEMERGVRIKPIGTRRMDVSNNVSGVTEVFAGQYREMYIKERTKQNAFEYARTRLKEEQGKVAALKGNALKEKVAEILYLKSLTKVDQAARNSEKFKQSLLPAHIASQKQKIMGSPEFKSFEKMPENQLRAMAAGKGAKNLMDNFMKTVAKVKEAQKQMQQRVNAPKQNGVPEAQKPAGPGVSS